MEKESFAGTAVALVHNGTPNRYNKIFISLLRYFKRNAIDASIIAVRGFAPPFFIRSSKAQSDLLTVLLEREKKSRRKIADLLLDVQAQRAKNADLVKEKAALEAARLNLSAKLKQLQGEFDILREKEARARDALGLINAVKRATQGQ